MVDAEEPRANGLLVKLLTPILAPFVIGWELVRVSVPGLGHMVAAVGRGLDVRIRLALAIGLALVREEGRVLDHLRARMATVGHGVAGAVADAVRAVGRAIARVLLDILDACRPAVVRAWVALRAGATAAAAAVRTAVRPMVLALGRWAGAIRALAVRAGVAVREVAQVVATGLREMGRAVAHVASTIAVAARVVLVRAGVAARGAAIAAVSMVRRVGSLLRRVAIAAVTVVLTPGVRLLRRLGVLVGGALRVVVTAASWIARQLTWLVRGFVGATLALTRRVAERMLRTVRWVVTRVIPAIAGVVQALAAAGAWAWRRLVTATAMVIRALARPLIWAWGRGRAAVSTVVGALVAAGAWGSAQVGAIAAVTSRAVRALARQLKVRLRTAGLILEWSVRVTWQPTDRLVMRLVRPAVAAIVAAARMARSSVARFVRFLAPVVIVPAGVLVGAFRLTVATSRVAWASIVRASHRVQVTVQAAATASARTLRRRSVFVRASVTTTVQDVRSSLHRLRRSVASALGRPLPEPSPPARAGRVESVLPPPVDPSVTGPAQTGPRRQAPPWPTSTPGATTGRPSASPVRSVALAPAIAERGMSSPGPAPRSSRATTGPRSGRPTASSPGRSNGAGRPSAVASDELAAAASGPGSPRVDVASETGPLPRPSASWSRRR